MAIERLFPGLDQRKIAYGWDGLSWPHAQGLCLELVRIPYSLEIIIFSGAARGLARWMRTEAIAAERQLWDKIINSDRRELMLISAPYVRISVRDADIGSHVRIFARCAVRIATEFERMDASSMDFSHLRSICMAPFPLSVLLEIVSQSDPATAAAFCLVSRSCSVIGHRQLYENITIHYRRTRHLFKTIVEKPVVGSWVRADNRYRVDGVSILS
jgi:hypothetical protein